MLKKVLKILGIVVIASVLAYAVYFACLVLSFERIPDNEQLEVQSFDKNANEIDTVQDAKVDSSKSHKMLSWNIGFGAFTENYGFCMDGGADSWAESEEVLDANLKKICEIIASENADFNILQEVDYGGTKVYDFDERNYFYEALPNMQSTYAINFHSKFLFYPLIKPLGFCKSGILSITDYTITSGLRRSLPIEDGFTKVFDLDRCYSISRIPVDNGHELCMYNLHLAAYTSKSEIGSAQIEMLLDDMQSEIEKGNYVIGGGDFNKNLLGDSSDIFGYTSDQFSWGQAIDMDAFEGKDLSLVVPFDEENPVPSVRNADAPYHEGQEVFTVDGFIVSNNITVQKSKVIDLNFKYSDHNPVYIEFTLKN